MTYKPPKRSGKMLSIKEALAGWTYHLPKNPVLIQARLEEAWPNVVGSIIAKHTTQLRVNGVSVTAYIAVPALRQQLAMNKTQVIQQLRGHLGLPDLAELVVL